MYTSSNYHNCDRVEQALHDRHFDHRVAGRRVSLVQMRGVGTSGGRWAPEYHVFVTYCVQGPDDDSLFVDSRPRV